MKDLISKCKEINRTRIENLNNTLYRVNTLNSESPIQVKFITPLGSVISSDYNIDSSSEESEIDKLYNHHFNSTSYISTRQQAKVILFLAGLNFNKAHYQLSDYHIELLREAAQLTKYRKPINSTKPIESHFFNHLKKDKYNNLNLEYIFKLFLDF